MATDRYPNQNVNIPFTDEEVATARARLTPGGGAIIVTTGSPPPGDGRGSRREVRRGEWIDDRVIQIGGPASPSKDEPPEPRKNTRALPTFSDSKAYQVTLAKPCIVDGRMLAPGKQYVMAGYVCTPITASIFEAVELGDIPDDPDITPSAAKTTDKPPSKKA